MNWPNTKKEKVGKGDREAETKTGREERMQRRERQRLTATDGRSSIRTRTDVELKGVSL